ncbi:hypothetical protein CPB85DRAFT_851473 [Mucidula mucida]|nr:hypothetical protein CPB85DRAFT_851473 [Mucidula mucida]
MVVLSVYRGCRLSELVLHRRTSGPSVVLRLLSAACSGHLEGVQASQGTGCEMAFCALDSGALEPLPVHVSIYLDRCHALPSVVPFPRRDHRLPLLGRRYRNARHYSTVSFRIPSTSSWTETPLSSTRTQRTLRLATSLALDNYLLGLQRFSLCIKCPDWRGYEKLNFGITFGNYRGGFGVDWCTSLWGERIHGSLFCGKGWPKRESRVRTS